MKRHNQFSALRLVVLFFAMSAAIFHAGCREKRPAGQTINRTELDTIIKATSRSDSLTKALESEFGGRGYRFMVAFASGGKNSNVVETLSGGPASLHVYGAETFKEAIELDRELNRFLEEQEQAEIEVLYEIFTEWDMVSPVMYPASGLAKSAESFAEIKKRQSASAGERQSALFGSWRSDAEATNAYLSKHAKMEDFQRKKLALFFGRATVTFKPDGSGSIRMAARTIPTKEGGEIELTEGTTEFTYRILGETKSQIVIESLTGEALTDAHPFAVLKLHDRDTYSVSLSDGIAEINGREFFKRVKEPDDGKDGGGEAAERGIDE